MNRFIQIFGALKHLKSVLANWCCSLNVNELERTATRAPHSEGVLELWAQIERLKKQNHPSLGALTACPTGKELKRWRSKQHLLHEPFESTFPYTLHTSCSPAPSTKHIHASDSASLFPFPALYLVRVFSDSFSCVLYSAQTALRTFRGREKQTFGGVSDKKGKGFPGQKA